MQSNEPVVPTMSVTTTELPSNGEVKQAVKVNQSTAKNPLMLINELKPGAKFSFISESGESHDKTFVVSVEVDELTFTGSGKNKRQAKSNAAQKALQALFGMTFSSSPGL